MTFRARKVAGITITIARHAVTGSEIVPMLLATRVQSPRPPADDCGGTDPTITCRRSHLVAVIVAKHIQVIG